MIDERLGNAQELVSLFGTHSLYQNGVSLGSHASIFQAEFMTIIQIPQGLLQLNTQVRIINMHSDRQTAIMAISKLYESSLLMSECKTIINLFASRHRMTVAWVPAHYDFQGNELAPWLQLRRGPELEFCLNIAIFIRYVLNVKP